MEKERIHFIDALRGYAILMMLQGHIVAAMLAPEYRDVDNVCYAVWSHMRGMTAAVFLFASGLIVSYLMFRGEVGQGLQRFHKTWKRGIWLMVLISLSPVIQNTWHWMWSGDFLKITVYPHASIIYLMGFALIMASGMAFVVQFKQRVYLYLVFTLSLSLFFFSPWISRWDTGFVVFDFFNQKRADMMFTISPWLGHFFMGCFFGVLAIKSRWYRKPWSLVSLILLGVLVKYWLFDVAQASLVALNIDWGNSSRFEAAAAQIYRHGEVLIVVGLMALLAHFKKAPEWLQNCGKETLTIFMLHLVVVYGAFFGIGYSSCWKVSLGPWESAFLAGTTVIAFIGLAQYLPFLRKKIPLLKLIH